MKEKNKIYSAADFQRYHSGTMPANEMNELEKAALEDPFLADALEGYVNTTSFENDIEELRERLNKRKKKTVFSISSITKSGWWRIAALFVVVAGAGYFFYRINYSGKENLITKNDSKSLTEKTNSAALSNTDSVAENNDVAFENHQVRRFEEKQKTTLPVVPKTDEQILANKEKSNHRSDVAIQSKKDFAYSEINKIEATGKQNDSSGLPKEKITGENDVPGASAAIKDKKNKEVLTDSTGESLLASADSNATVTATGYESKKIKLKRNEQQAIAINKNNANDAVSNSSKQEIKKEPSTPLNELQGKVAGVNITPLSNNKDFDQYIKDSTSPVYNEDHELQKGEVELSFTINKLHRPENIKVIRSSCKACEEEAIRLLKKGPDWPGRKNKPGNVIIKF